MKMKMIVTGSAGFIGKALCQELRKRAVEVIEIDRVTGQEASTIGEYLKDGDVACVFHLAAQTSVFNDDLVQIRKDNIDTFMIVADECERYHVKLVYASSSTANLCNITSMYGISKHFDEQYASIYCKNATGVRLHNVYAPNPRNRTLLWYLLNRDKVELYNYGQNIRCFTYIDDVIEGLTQPIKLLGVYFVIAFFAAQMFACFEYSHLDKCLAIMGADLLSSFEPAPLSALILFILFTAFINLIMVSATSKWAFMSFIFIPMFAQMGISPDVTQCAFRIGDSSTNAITPFLFYMPLVLTYMRYLLKIPMGL